MANYKASRTKVCGRGLIERLTAVPSTTTTDIVLAIYAPRQRQKSNSCAPRTPRTPRTAAADCQQTSRARTRTKTNKKLQSVPAGVVGKENTSPPHHRPRCWLSVKGGSVHGYPPTHADQVRTSAALICERFKGTWLPAWTTVSAGDNKHFKDLSSVTPGESLKRREQTPPAPLGTNR